MEKLRALLRQTEFQVLLVFVCLVLFGWPVVSFGDVERLEVMFLYLFTAWAIVILVLFLVCRSQEITTQTEKRGTEQN